MSWNNAYPKGSQPALTQIAHYIDSPLWQDFCDHVQTEYLAEPRVEHSICSGAPGWNIKYQKSRRSLCTLYPHQGFFTALICAGAREQVEAELLLPCCCPYLRELYQKAKPVNGTRWLMIDVTDETILAQAKQLVGIRAGRKASHQSVLSK